MSSEEKNSDFQEKTQLINNNQEFNSSLQIKKDDEKSEDNKLIKPIPINPKLINDGNNSIPKLVNTSVKLNNFNQDAAMPIIHSKFPINHQIAQNGSLNEKNIYNFYQSKKSENIDSNEFCINKLCCNCTKTKCIKKYCECYANKKYCKDCNCQDCLNIVNYFNNNNTNQFINENEIIICTCSKSNCNKKYCECYKSGVKCNDKCRCINCMNTLTPIILPIKEEFDNNNDIKYNSKKSLDNIKNLKNKNISVENKNTITKNFEMKENLNEKFKIQRISVFINKNKTMINVEKFSKEEMNLLCKKRKHN